MEPEQANFNEISDETGQHDPRFILWREFCAGQGIPVESLPGDLSGEEKDRWEEFKKAKLGPRGD